MTVTDIKDGLTNIKLIVGVTMVCLLCVVVLSLWNAYNVHVFYERACDNTLALRDTVKGIVVRAEGNDHDPVAYQAPTYNPTRMSAKEFYVRARSDLDQVHCL